MGASGVNWNNVPHETILGQINGGAGVGPVSDAAASYRRIAGTLREADQDLRDALSAADASWEGQAAADMQTASTPLATWADEADQMATQTGSSTEVFGDQFADTRSSMPAAVSVPSGSWVDDTGLSGLPGVTTDRERAEAAADAAQQEAARRMEAYDNASYDTVQTQYFSQPPTVVLVVPSPAAGGGSGVGGTSTTVSGTAPSGAYVVPGGYTAPGGAVNQSPAVTGGTVVGGGAVPSSPTAPAGVAPASTIPSTAGGVPAGGVPGGSGSGGFPPVAGGGPVGGAAPGLGGRPGTSGSGSRPGSGTGGSTGFPGVGPLPGVPGLPGLPGRGYGAGGYGPGGYGPGGYGPGGYGPGGYGPGGYGPGGSGGAGGLAGFADEAHGQRGTAGPGGFGAAGIDPDGPGARAGAGYGPMGAGRAQGDEDTEHKRPDYLVETEDIWGDGTRVAPPVIGERPAQ